MDIPMKYEDVVAKLDAALGREAALREELHNARLASSDTHGLIEAYEESKKSLQQRLTVAEQLLAATHTYVEHIAGTGIGSARRLTAQIETHFDDGRAAEVPGSTCNQIREESGLPTKNPCVACNGGACIDR